MNVTQAWTHELPMMQQTVLLTAIRGPDGIAKYGAVKMLLRWYRRCVLLSALDQRVLNNPCEVNGGSFTGPSVSRPDVADRWEAYMDEHICGYLKQQDELPFHFQMHFMHSVEILGYKHPCPRIRYWWSALYIRLVHSMHLHPETQQEMDSRLGDSREGWLERADPATSS